MASLPLLTVALDLDDDVDRRGIDRARLDRPGVLRLDALPHDVRIDDLTRDGCKITTALDLETGTAVVIGLAGIGSCNAQIVWCAQDGYGCLFDEPLMPGAVTAAMRNNVNSFTRTQVSPPLGASDVKMSPRTRALAVIGATASLWAVLWAGYSVLV